jgi:hypothetical protein
VEDFTAPSHLCPVCLRKLQFRLGFDVLQRYEGLLAVFQKWDLGPEARWVADRLQSLRSPEAACPEAGRSLARGRSASREEAKDVSASSRASRKRKGREPESQSGGAVVDLTAEGEEGGVRK